MQKIKISHRAKFQAENKCFSQGRSRYIFSLRTKSAGAHNDDDDDDNNNNNNNNNKMNH